MQPIIPIRFLRTAILNFSESSRICAYRCDMDNLRHFVQPYAKIANKHLQAYEPVQLVAMTIVTLVTLKVVPVSIVALLRYGRYRYGRDQA